MKHRWMVISDGKYVHVLHANDSKPHGTLTNDPRVPGGKIITMFGLECPCSPQTLFGYFGLMILQHNCFRHKDMIDESMLRNFGEK